MTYLFNEEGFNQFREEHPQMRYFQALKNYLGVDKVEVAYREDEEFVREDTYYWHDDE